MTEPQWDGRRPIIASGEAGEAAGGAASSSGVGTHEHVFGRQETCALLVLAFSGAGGLAQVAHWMQQGC